MRMPRRVYHGTMRPDWSPHDWVHVGDLPAATRRLKAVQDGFEEDEYEGGVPTVFSMSIDPSATVSPKVAARYDREIGVYRDLGDRLRDGDDARIQSHMKNFDVIPYENVGEGGTSFYVKGSSLRGVAPFKRYLR